MALGLWPFIGIYADVVQNLLMLKIFFTQDSVDEDFFCGASPGSKPSLFFSSYLFSLGSKLVQDDFRHDLAYMTDEANGSVIMAEL